MRKVMTMNNRMLFRINNGIKWDLMTFLKYKDSTWLNNRKHLLKIKIQPACIKIKSQTKFNNS